MKSKLFSGYVEHTRQLPVRHSFKYRLYVYAIDLDELAVLDRRLLFFGYNRLRPVSLFDSDYLDPRPGSIKEKLIRYLAAEGIEDRVDSILLITSARYFNYIFNPVSFYYCMNANGGVIRMVAEVNNTFGERHVYIPKQKPQTGSEDAKSPYWAAKAFHVSPFNDVAGEYAFMFSHPHAKDLDIQIRLFKAGTEAFCARLYGESVPLTATHLLKLILRHPLVPHLTKPRIFMEAARLYFLRHLEYHPKPEAISPMTIIRTPKKETRQK